MTSVFFILSFLSILREQTNRELISFRIYIYIFYFLINSILGEVLFYRKLIILSEQHLLIYRRVAENECGTDLTWELVARTGSLDIGAGSIDEWFSPRRSLCVNKKRGFLEKMRSSKAPLLDTKLRWIYYPWRRA